jgi:hypothetical protein
MRKYHKYLGNWDYIFMKISENIIYVIKFQNATLKKPLVDTKEYRIRLIPFTLINHILLANL